MSTDLGHATYQAYATASAHKLPDGKTKLPKWDDLDDKQKRAWARAAGAAASAAMVELADRIDGGGPSTQPTVQLREQAAQHAAYDPREDQGEVEQVEVPVNPGAVPPPAAPGATPSV